MSACRVASLWKTLLDPQKWQFLEYLYQIHFKDIQGVPVQMLQTSREFVTSEHSQTFQDFLRFPGQLQR